ncbi:MAG: zinc ribbon domain-containing protein [Planctomycetota bacterium]
MPTYDYQCSSCGKAWESFQSMSARPTRKCPYCGKLTAKRLIGIGAGVIFKGGGFYETDYRDGKYDADAKKDSGESSDAKSDTKADSQNDAKADAKPAKSSKAKPAAEKAAKKVAKQPAKSSKKSAAKK